MLTDPFLHPSKNGQSQKETTPTMLVRDGAALFRNIHTLSQVSGVPTKWLQRLVAKELTDNALDAGANCRVGEMPDGGFFIEDDGPGIPGTPNEIAEFFSFGRPLTSSKLLRLPTRGAMGQGLRVVAGVVYASVGRLRVMTGGFELDLEPQANGQTVVKSKKRKATKGLRVEVILGESLPVDFYPLTWAEEAIAAKGAGPIYFNRPSPWFFDTDSFHELFLAAGHLGILELIRTFDGFDNSSKALRRYSRQKCSSVSDEQAEQILGVLRAGCPPVEAKKLVPLGKSLSGYYAIVMGILNLEPGRGNLSAQLPYSVEVWCRRASGDDDVINILVNRTPVTGEVVVLRPSEKHKLNIYGCNLRDEFDVGRKPVVLTLNIQIPYMPIVTAGKEPDLEYFIDDIRKGVEAAAKKCSRADSPEVKLDHGFFPTPLPKGRPNPLARAKHRLELVRFADQLKEIISRLDFRLGVRGVCYIIENLGLITKGEFDKAESLITHCRKEGLLPIDIMAEDEGRQADHLERLDSTDPAVFVNLLAGKLDGWKNYSPVSFWANQHSYVEVLVEKIDLKSLFSTVCQKYHVPLINSRGWSDLNLRVAMMRRFALHEAQGRRPVLLYFGDHDPVGMQIPEIFPKHLAELEKAVGWSPRNLKLERVGLNADFIENHKLLWIDGLETSGGKDLSHPSHKLYKAPHVQDYLQKFGARKVEANALVVRPIEGRKLCEDAILKLLDINAIAEYERELNECREQARRAMPEALARYQDEQRRLAG